MTVVARRAFGQARAGAVRRHSRPPPTGGDGTASTVDSLPEWRDPDPLDSGASVVGTAYARLVDDYLGRMR